MAATTKSHEDDSAADLASGLLEDAQRLIHLEIQLAKQETKELVVSNLIAGGLLTAAAFLVTIAIFVAVPVLIVVILPWHWQAAAVWFGAYLVAAIGLGVGGRLLLKVGPPRRTIESLKETRDWLRSQMRSSGR